MKANDLNQTTAHNYYCSPKRKISKRLILSVIQACTEFSALDGRTFEVMKGDGFQNIAHVLFNVGRLCAHSSIKIKDILPHPTTVRKTSISANIIVNADFLLL
jgi:hypothetical protein